MIDAKQRGMKKMLQQQAQMTVVVVLLINRIGVHDVDTRRQWMAKDL